MGTHNVVRRRTHLLGQSLAHDQAAHLRHADPSPTRLSPRRDAAWHMCEHAGTCPTELQ